MGALNVGRRENISREIIAGRGARHYFDPEVQLRGQFRRGRLPAAEFNPRVISDAFYTDAAGQGTAGSYSQPNADPGTIAGTGLTWGTTNPPPGHTAYLAGVAGSGRVEFAAGYFLAGLNSLGLREIEKLAYSVEYTVRAEGGAWGSADRALWTDGIANAGFWFLNGVPKVYNLIGSGYHGPSGALPTTGPMTGGWNRVIWVFSPTLLAKCYVNGTLVFTEQSSSALNVTLKDLMGARVASSSYEFIGDCGGLRVYDFEMTAAEVTSRQSDTELFRRPVYRIDATGGSGSTVTDDREVLGTGSLVATIDNQAGTDLTASGGERPLFVSNSPQPADRNPAILPSSLRFDGNANQASATALLSSSVSDLCGYFGLRVSKALEVAQGLAGTYDVPVAVWGASSASGAGAYGTSTSVSWITLGYRWPAYSGKIVPCGWEVRIKPLGTSTIQRVHGSLALGLPVRVGFRFHGGATAAARYLEVWVNGVSVGTPISGSALPANLDLSSGFTLCPQDGTNVYRAGIDLDAAGIGTGAWSAGDMAKFDGWFKKRGNYQDFSFQELFGVGQVFSSDPFGFNLGPFVGPNGLAGGVIAAATNGNTDPADNMRVPWRVSADRGNSWNAEQIAFDPNGSASPAGYIISPPFYHQATGKCLLALSTSPAVGNLPWVTYFQLSTNNGGSFDTPFTPTVSGLPANYVYNPGTFLGYWSPAGNIVELPDGKVRMLCEGWYSTSGSNSTLGQYHVFVIEGDATLTNWTFLVDVSLATGDTGKALGEPSMAWVAGSGAAREWVLVMREIGVVTRITSSRDDMGSWDPSTALGSSTSLGGGGQTTDTSLWYGATDSQTRYWLIDPPRNQFEASPPNPTFTANRCPGLALAWSSSLCQRWDGILQVTFGPHGWHYGNGMDDGAGNMLIGTTFETLKGGVLKIPYAAFSWPGS